MQSGAVVSKEEMMQGLDKISEAILYVNGIK